MKSEYENGFIAGIAQEKETQMNLSKYNGWTNYATWRVNLEIFDGLSPEDLGYFGDDALELYDIIQEYAKECIYQSGSGNSSLAVDYALSFLSDVDWYQIAKHKIEEYADEDTSEKLY